MSLSRRCLAWSSLSLLPASSAAAAAAPTHSRSHSPLHMPLRRPLPLLDSSLHLNAAFNAQSLRPVSLCLSSSYLFCTLLCLSYGYFCFFRSSVARIQVLGLSEPSLRPAATASLESCIAQVCTYPVASHTEYILDGSLRQDCPQSLSPGGGTISSSSWH